MCVYNLYSRCFKAIFQRSLSFVKFENNSQDVQFASTENEQPKSEDNNGDDVKLAEVSSEEEPQGVWWGAFHSDTKKVSDLVELMIRTGH